MFPSVKSYNWVFHQKSEMSVFLNKFPPTLTGDEDLCWWLITSLEYALLGCLFKFVYHCFMLTSNRWKRLCVSKIYMIHNIENDGHNYYISIIFRFYFIIHYSITNTYWSSHLFCLNIRKISITESLRRKIAFLL